MSLFVEDLFTFLSSNVASVASRIYPNKLPQSPTLPAIRYFQVSEPFEHSHDGPSGFHHPRFQLDCFGATYLEARTVAGQVISVMDGYKGTMGNSTCQAGFADNMLDHHDPDTQWHWVSVDFIIWYS